LTLSASDVSDAVLEQLEKLTGRKGPRDALQVLYEWNFARSPLTGEQADRLLDFAIHVAEVEVCRPDEGEGEDGLGPESR
jgi:hypothetical protein